MSKFLLHAAGYSDELGEYPVSKIQESIEATMEFAKHKEEVVDLDTLEAVCCAFVPTAGKDIKVLVRGDELFIERNCHEWDFSDHKFPENTRNEDDTRGDCVAVLLNVIEPDHARRMRLLEGMKKLASFLEMEDWFYIKGEEPSELTEFIINYLETMQDLIYSPEDFFDELVEMLNFFPGMEAREQGKGIEQHG